MQTTPAEIEDWFESYFAAVNQQQGNIESVVGLRQYFTEDLQFWMFTAPAFIEPPLCREQLLLTFVHPVLHENLVPRQYVIDAEQLTAVVHFEIRFTRLDTGYAWRPLQASAHYGLERGGESGLRIRSIRYWTESHHEVDDVESLLRLWTTERDKCLLKFGLAYLDGGLGKVN